MLADTVSSILQGHDVPTELIIIDQSVEPHSTLADLKTDRVCDIRYFLTRTIGASRARNAGIAAAQHSILAFTDDDMLATPDWFGNLIQALVNLGSQYAVTGQVLPTAAEVPGGFAPSPKIDETPAVYGGRVGKDVLYSGNMAVYHSSIEKIGGFDERLGPGTAFPAAEDNDFGLRLLEGGYHIAYVPQAMIYHRAWRSERDHIRLRWNYARGQGAFYAKHLCLRDHYMLGRLVNGVKNHAVQCLRRVRHDRNSAHGDAMYILGLLSGVVQWLLTQRTSR